MRRAPAIFDRRLGEWEPKPQFIPFPEFEFPPPPANPVIPIRIGMAPLERAEAFVVARHLPFPYWQLEAPANPVIQFRYGQDVLAGVEKLVGPQLLPFPFFQEAVAAAPVISFRYGQVALVDPEKLAVPFYMAFPYFIEEIPPGGDPGTVIAYYGVKRGAFGGRH